MMRKVALAVLVFVVSSVAALAADFNGKWSASVDTPMGTQALTLDFHVDGSKLTGKVISQMGEMPSAKARWTGIISRSPSSLTSTAMI